MNHEKVLSIHVKTDDYFGVKGHIGSVGMVGFHGNAESEYFMGKILPGGIDTQRYDKNGVGQLSARYILEGVDLQGEDCRIFIENNGRVVEGEIRTFPRIITDSEALSWLEYAKLEGRIVNEEAGIRIDIFEKTDDFERSELSFTVAGKTIYGELYKPCGQLDKYPLVIASHGYNSCCKDMRSEMEELAKRGIACYCYDFCGGSTNSKSSGKTTQMTIKTEQQDLRDVVEYIEKLAWIDKNKMYLYGSSQGGFVTALTAPEFTDKIRGIFLMFPAFCIPDDWRERKKNNTQERIEFMEMTLGKCFVDELPDYDVFERAALYGGEVHIFHGTSDPVVSLEYSVKLAKSYPNAQLTVYPGQAHGFEKKFVIAAAAKIASHIHMEDARLCNDEECNFFANIGGNHERE